MSSEIAMTFEQMLASLVLLLPRVVASAVILGATFLVAGLASRAVSSALTKRKASPEAALLTRRILRWSVIMLGGVAALAQVGFDVTAFLTGLGVIGFTVGFAIQDVSKNLVAGLLLLLQQPFELGSVVTIGGYTGTVQTVDLRATHIRTFDGRMVLIPNADVYTTPIVNFGRGTRRRLDLTAGVAYESDLDFVTKTALEAIASIPGVLTDPAPALVFSALGPSTVDFQLFYWIDTGETGFLFAKDAGIKVIKSAFEQAGIEMPYPIQTIHLKQ